MATVWGRATVIVDADGRGLPAQTKAIAEKAGDQAGESFSDKFDKSANKGLRGTLDRFRESFRKWDENLKKTDSNLGRLSRRTKAFLKTVGNTTPMLRARLALTSLKERLDALSTSFDRTNGHLGNQQNLWHRLSANTRQWTLIIGAVIASMSELAGLASAAGSGLFVLGGALSSVIATLGLAVVGFVRFMGDIKNLPAELRPARKAFDQFRDTLKGVADTIAISAFRGTEDVWASLSKTVKGLTPAFEEVGRVVNGLLRDFSKFLAVGTPGFKNLNGFITKSAGIFDRVTRAAGRFGASLLTLFNDPSFQRSINEFLGWIDTLINRFDDFVNSDGLDEWLQHGRDVFGAFGRLLDTTGRVLNNLVTNDSIAKLVTFIDNIGRFLEGGGQDLLTFAEKLDVFGIIAQALADFGDALKPLAEPTAEFAGALRDVVDSGIQSLAGILENLATIMAPLVKAFADFMKANPTGVANGLLAIAGGLLALKGVSGLAALSGRIGLLTTKTDALGKSVRVFNLKKLGGITAGLVALTAVSVPQDWLNGLIGEGAGGLAQLQGQFALIGSFFGGIGALIGVALATVVNLFTDFNGTMDALLPQIVVAIVSPFAGALTGLGQLLPEFRNFLGEWMDNLRAVFDPAQWAALWSDLGIIIHDGVQSWSDILTNWRDVELPAWWAGVVGWWNSIMANFVAGTGGWLDQIVTRWNATLTAIKTNVTNWWSGIIAGWNTFWSGVWSNIQRGLSTISTFFATAFNGVRKNWDTFWKGLGTVVSGVWGTIVSSVKTAVNQVIGFINSLISKINGALRTIKNLTGGLVNFQIPDVPGFASGGVLTGPRRILAGEAGPEAIVPLNRPLSQVDPSVRGLSAVAQGKAASGAVVGGPSRTINVESGAIVIQGSRDPRAVAIETVDRLVEVAS